MKALIDTNVILDALMGREPFNTAAEEIIILSAEEKISACITASSVTDIYYILKKYIKQVKLARQAILKLMTVVNVLDVTGSDCEKACELPMEDYEDALCAYCARRHKVDCIVTRDFEHFEGSPVEAMKPDVFLKIVKADLNG